MEMQSAPFKNYLRN